MVPRNTAAMKLAIILNLVLLRGLSAVMTDITLDLQPGWNSVWLDVSPKNAEGDAAEVGEVFSDSAISFVAQPTLPSGSAEFIADTRETRFNQSTWKSWWRSSEINENSLAIIQGDQAYLVKVEGDAPVTLVVRGEVQFRQSRLRARSYTLQGFHLDGAPSFDEFFSAAGATVPVNRIFRLNSGGEWAGVVGSDTMRSHESYWIFAEKVTRFTGPVAVKFNNYQGLNFGGNRIDVELPDPDGGVGSIFVNLEELAFSNLSAQAHDVGLRKLGGAAADDELRIFLVEPEAEFKSYALGNQVNDEVITTLAAGESDVVTLGAYRNWNEGAAFRENLYQIVAGHQVMWLPVRAENPALRDLAVGEVQAEAQGLWIGNVHLTEVNRGNSSTMDETTSAMNLRCLFHVDTAGVVSLLSHVMLMQEKRGSTEVIPKQVLLIDEGKIPFFEGIEERGGKRVGVRLESAGYDLPRVTTIENQAELLDEVVALSDTDSLVNESDVTNTDLSNYLNSRSSRPPELVEEYYRSWVFDGGFGPGQSVESAAPLLLDPFHRSNPFRHAFHPRHAAGYAIERAIEIDFDAEQAEGILTGIYTETLSGLTSYPIMSSGTIRLQRVSEVGERVSEVGELQ